MAPLTTSRVDLLNLTPHQIDLIWDGGRRHLPPEGTVARVEVRRVQAPSLTLPDGVPLPVWETRLGAAIDLPEERPAVALVVSQMVAQALPSRRDLFFPDELIRDGEGRVIGCASLAQVAPPRDQ